MAGGKVIIFIPGNAEPPDELQDMLSSIGIFAVTEIVRSFRDLSKQLLPQAADRPRPIVIVLAPTKGDLESLLEVHELFENTRLVLLLADADTETVALGHRMRPRFIGYLPNGLRGIADVVRKMAGGRALASQYVRGGFRHDHG